MRLWLAQIKRSAGSLLLHAEEASGGYRPHPEDAGNYGWHIGKIGRRGQEVVPGDWQLLYCSDNDLTAERLGLHLWTSWSSGLFWQIWASLKQITKQSKPSWICGGKHFVCLWTARSRCAAAFTSLTGSCGDVSDFWLCDLYAKEM